MAISRTESPIWDDLKAWFKVDDQWQQVVVLSAITEQGCVRNRVRLPDGRETEVGNDGLRFGRKPRR